MDVDEPDPEFERLMAWYIQSKDEILKEFGASGVDFSTDELVFLGSHEQIIKTIREQPNDPCPCGSGKKFKKCCGRAI